LFNIFRWCCRYGDWILHWVREKSLALFALLTLVMLAQLYLERLTGRYGVFVLTDEERSPKL
jgi:hypothetical protein